MKKHAIIPIFVPHIGCSESCVFCDQKQITARSKAPSPEEVRDTIDTWLTTLSSAGGKSQAETQADKATTFIAPAYADGEAQVRPRIEVAFYGGSFTAIPMAMQERYLSIAKEYLDRGDIDSIHLSTRPDCIDKEILDMLWHYGVRTIELGVQSFDDQVLLKSKRGHTSSAVREACHLIKEYRPSGNYPCCDGFRLGIQLMVGLPGDSLESCIYSAKEAVKLEPDLARIYPTLVLEGTELMAMYEAGEYTPLSRHEAIYWSKAVYEILNDAGIYIMRVGLKSTDIINSTNLGEINSGAYHPAFRQLVEGEIAKERIQKLLEDDILYVNSNDSRTSATVESNRASLTIYCAPTWISNAAGHKGANRKFFEEKYPQYKLQFAAESSLMPGEFRIHNLD